MAKLTQLEIAGHLDLSQPAVSKMIADGVLPKPTSARPQTLDDYRVIYIRHLREQAAGRAPSDDEDGAPDLVTERALLARAQRIGHTLKNAVMRSELLPIEDVEEVVRAVLDAVRAKFLSLPTKGAPLCVGLKSLNEARTVLTKLVHDALTDLASTTAVVAAAADRARHRIGSRAAGDEADAGDEAATRPDGEPVG